MSGLSPQFWGPEILNALERGVRYNREVLPHQRARRCRPVFFPCEICGCEARNTVELDYSRKRWVVCDIDMKRLTGEPHGVATKIPEGDVGPQRVP